MIIAGKYEVLSELGRGGMGVVYKVRHVALGATYAVKTLPSRYAQDPEMVVRFRQEARVMATLEHPNIVRVVDIGDDDDLHFLVMQYVDGESLHQRIKQSGPLPVADVIRIATHVGLALRHAHDHVPMIVHRDIKPSNILIERTRGHAVVADFGIAKILGGESLVHTKAGFIVGTLRYCAPEQLAGSDAIDGRADVFSLGMVIYEMLTGRHPLVNCDDAKVVSRALDVRTSYDLEFPSTTSAGIQQLIRRALEKNRDARYAHVGELIDDLRALQDGSPPTELSASLNASGVAVSPRALRRRLSILGATATALVSLVFLAGLEAQRSGWWSRMGRAVGTRVAAVGQSKPPTGAGAGAPAATREQPRGVGIMDFTASVPDQEIAWMKDVIRDNLSGQLSAAPGCKVFAKEFIDFKAEALMKKGAYSNLRDARMEVAQQLGVTTAIFGRFEADGPGLRIEAYVVDMDTGVQEPVDRVEGTRAQFAALQGELASKIMTRLDIAVPASVREASKGDIDNYKLLLGAEGGGDVAKPAPQEDRSRDSISRGVRVGKRVVTVLLRQLGPAAALADGEADAMSRSAILETLETYRRAYESKDLSLLGRVYGTLSTQQSAAAQQYFANAEKLQVTIEDIDVAVEGNRAAVSYTRRDHFNDAKTGENHTLEVRLTKMMVQSENGWIIASNK